MKLFILLITILFSASVLADCCNFEVESSKEYCSSIKKDHSNDNCGDKTQHSEEAQHCHCSPINHFKIISQN